MHALRDFFLQPESFLNTVWISCEGEYPADVENVGTINYYPIRGIPGYYFPYYQQEGYQTPFVFVHLQKPYGKLGSAS